MTRPDETAPDPTGDVDVAADDAPAAPDQAPLSTEEAAQRDDLTVRPDNS
ncbi:MAG: hypothetical protein JWL64_2455 [Frankiales bacterium]|nr:hypothetical protein [Frankiales bacterium]